MGVLVDEAAGSSLRSPSLWSFATIRATGPATLIVACRESRGSSVNEVNSSGCVGPMQLGVGGACGNFFARNKQDGDGDGKTDPRNPADAIYTAAYGLRKDKGAPPIGGSEAAYRRAACNYYGACEFIVPYADQVMARANAYGFQGGRATDLGAANALVDAQGGGCAHAADDLGGTGVAATC